MYSLLAFISGFAVCQAQFHPNPFGSSNTNATTYDVDVGKSGLTFEPSTLHAVVGDTINFHFWPSNHSIAESTFLKPCQSKSGGIDVHPIFSGFVPTRKGASAMFSMRLNVSDPIWLYSSQTLGRDHCKNGQVMVINPLNNTSQNLQAYVDASRASTNTTSPKDFYGGILLKDNAASPNVTATGVDVATQTKKSNAANFRASAWFALGVITAFIAAL